MDISIKIGIDPSINCTGICVWNVKENKHTYFMIPSKMTKKMKEFNNPWIKLLPYEKAQVDTSDYSTKEYVKFNNIYNICMHVVDIIDSLNTDNHTIKVYMEGVSYGSIGSAALIDLSFLNATIRMVLKMKEIEFVIVSPTSVKKFACANGQAEKDIMIDAWKRLDKNISDINAIKVDDLADAYFLSHYN